MRTPDEPAGAVSPAGRASRTAVLVCQGRAVADGRLAVGRFHDPVAVRLLAGDELVPVEHARADVRPGDWRADWRARTAVELVRACGELMAPRTVAIDDGIAEAGCPQVVILGAGLDARPWRLPALGEAVVFTVDHPASQADALRRTAGLVPTARRLVPVAADLGRGELDPALSRAGHHPGRPTTWVWEGVVPYLTAREVEATVATLAARSAGSSVLVVNYQSRSLVAVAGRRLSRFAERLSGQPSPLAGEPWRSLWTVRAMRELLSRYGFAVSRDEDLLTIAARLGTPRTHRRSLANGRVALARFPGPAVSPD